MQNVTFYEMPYTDVSVLEVRLNGMYINVVRKRDGSVVVSDPFLVFTDETFQTEELGVQRAIELLTHTQK